MALKTLGRFDARALVRFKHEFRALHDVDHPNLVSLYELHEADGEPFFTMELLDGQDFFEYVRPRNGPFDEGRLRRALAQLAALPDHAQIIEGNCVEIVPEDLAIAETACTVASDAYPQVMQAAPGV